MRKLYLGLLTLFVLVGALLVVSTPAAAAPGAEPPAPADEPVLVSTCPTDLFFSEYIEGSSNNKALEIFNGTGAEITLTGAYTVAVYNNGNTVANNTANLDGTLADGEVFVIANSSADAIILNQADMTSSVTFFNGDDALALYHNGVLIDVWGQIGVDTDWGKDVTLVRKPSVMSGDTNPGDAFIPSDEWLEYPQNTFSYLASHTMNPCGPVLSLRKSAPLMVDASEVFSYTLVARNDTGGTMTTLSVMDTLPLSVTYASSDPMGIWSDASHTIFWSGDSLASGEALTYTVVVTAPGASATLHNTDYSVWADEWVTPTGHVTVTTEVLDCTSIYNIQSHTDPGYGSLCVGEEVALDGIVYGIYDGNGFAFAEASGPWHGIFAEFSGTYPSVGDSVIVTGTVEENFDFTQLTGVTYTVHSTGNTPYATSQVSTSDVATGQPNAESYEGVLVEVNDVTVTNADLGNGEWAIADTSGVSVVVNDLGYAYTPSMGEALLLVRGMLNYSFDDFKIEPRDAGDVVAPAGTGLVVSKSGPATVQAGEALTYTLVVENQTAQLLTGVMISDTLPMSATYARSDPMGTWDMASHTLTWTHTSLAYGDALTYTIVVTAPTAWVTLVNEQYAAWASEWVTPTSGSAVTTTVSKCTTIYDVQYTEEAGDDGDYPSPCLDQDVTLEGIVYGVYPEGFFIAEGSGPWQSVYVYYPSGNLPELGDQVAVNGTVKEHFGLTQISNYATYDVLSSGNVPYPATLVTTVEIPGEDEDTAEPYESVLVRVDEITVTNTGTYFWTFTDATGGSSYATDPDWGYDPDPDVGDTYAILQGALVYTFNSYRVMPRGERDVVSSQDMMLSKAASQPIESGELFTYTLTLDNLTGIALTNLTITDAVPISTTFAYALDGGWSDGEVVTWTTPSLAVDGSWQVRFAVTVTAAANQVIVNQSYVAWAENWPNAAPGEPLHSIVGDYLPIPLIQGDGFRSSREGHAVRTQGVVVGFFEGNNPNFDGFFIQDATWDSDPDTSDAIFVHHATSLNPGVSIGELVTVEGVVEEFSEWDGTTCMGEQCMTVIMISGAGDITSQGAGTMPDATVVAPPGDAQAGAAYWESHEGMLVTIPVTATVVGPTSYNTVHVVPGDLGIERVLRTGPYAGMPVGLRHYERNGRIGGSHAPDLIVGSVITDADGPLAYTYGSYAIITQEGDPWRVDYSKPLPATVPEAPEPGAGTFTAGTFNTLNFDASGGLKMQKVLSTVVGMGCPTFLSLQEIDVSASMSGLLAGLDAVNCPYDYTYSHPDVGSHGVAVLWRTDQVTDVVSSTAYQGCSPVGTTSSTYDPLWDTCRAMGEYPLFSRRPVVVTGTVTVGARPVPVVAIGNHFKSKSGGDPDDDQRRLEQAQLVAGLADMLMDGVPNVIVLGDLNEFEDYPPLEALYASGTLTNTWYQLPEEARYSYIYRGVSQILDHVLVSPPLLEILDSVTPLHYNADYPYGYTFDPVVWRTSDHDPIVASFSPLMPDLELTKEVVPEMGVMAGDVVTYTITVENLAAGAAMGVLVTDTLPSMLTFGGWVQQPAGATRSGADLRWEGWASQSMPATLMFTATLASDFTGAAVVNHAYFDSPYGGSGMDAAAFTVVATPRHKTFLPLVLKAYP